MNQVLTAYERIRSTFDRGDVSRQVPLPRMDLVRFRCRRETPDPTTPQAVIQAVTDFTPSQGWLCLQSKVLILDCAEDLEQGNPNDGVILSGELVRGANHSLHIRQNGQGGWILLYIDEGEGDQEGLVHNARLLGNQHYLATVGENARAGVLCYRVYWTHEHEHGWRQSLSRLCGMYRHADHDCARD